MLFRARFAGKRRALSFTRTSIDVRRAVRSAHEDEEPDGRETHAEEERENHHRHRDSAFWAWLGRQRFFVWPVHYRFIRWCAKAPSWLRFKAAHMLMFVCQRKEDSGCYR